MERILQGVTRFQKEIFPQKKELFERLARDQQPDALFITCADSRIVPDLITQSGPGELFICRNVGNMVPAYGQNKGGVSAAIEYAVCALNVPNIIICGHYDCGAIKAILNPEKLGEMETVRSWLTHGDLARQIVLDAYPDRSGTELANLLAEENVISQLEHLKTHPCVASRLMRGTLRIHGWVYHIETGRMSAWDAQREQYLPIEEYSFANATPRPRLNGSLNGRKNGRDDKATHNETMNHQAKG